MGDQWTGVCDPHALREPGWYRFGVRGWEPVSEGAAAEELLAGGGWDLVYIDPGITIWACDGFHEPGQCPRSQHPHVTHI